MARSRSGGGDEPLAGSAITVELVGTALHDLRQPQALTRFSPLVALARRALSLPDTDPGHLTQALLLQAIVAVGRSNVRVVKRGPDYFQVILTAVYVDGQAQKDVFPRYRVGSDTTFSRHLQRGVEAATDYLRSLEQTHRMPNGSAKRGNGAASSRQPTAMLRRPLTSFVGRDEEMAILAGYLSARDQGRPRLITLAGPPGVGKSRLAVEAALAARPHFAHLWFVSLAAVADPAAVLPAIAAALPIDPDLAPEPVQRLRQYLADRPALLVLDNCERLRAAASDLLDLLLDCPGLALLVTSRWPLHAEGEHVLRVSPLAAGPIARSRGTLNPSVFLQEALRQPAVRLFADRARATDACFTIGEGNAGVVVELCRRLDGLPLAIEIVAARLGDRTPPPLDRLLSLELPHRPHLARHTSLERAIAWSYDALPAEAQRLFRCCAAFEGTFGRTAAAAVSGRPDDGEGTTETLLDALADQHLLESRGDGEARYAMLSTLRQYARHRLQENPEEAAAVYARMTAYYIDLAQSAERDLFGPAQVATLDRLEQERENLRAALRHAVAAHDRTAALALIGPLWMFWSLRGHVRDAHDWLEPLLPRKDASAGVPAPILAKALFCAGVLAAFERDAAASAYYSRARDLYRCLGDRRWEGWCLLGLGQAAVERARHDVARRLLLEALDCFRATGDLPGTGWALSNLARQRLAESAAVWQEVGDAWGRGTCLSFLANQEHLDGRDADAVGHYEQSIRCFADLGFHLARAWRLLALGDVLRRVGDDHAARERYEAGLQLFAEQNAPDGLAWALHNLTYPALHAGDLRGAKDLLRLSLALFRDQGRDDGLAACLVGAAGIALAKGDAPAAARFLGSSQRLSGASVRLDPADRAEYERISHATRAALGQEAWARYHGEGYAAPIERALA